ncbi:hypothetical protein [Streptomyces sp. NPDC088725]|uniref:hypothetical protein n=1 Tax=Streptomyces sp. NPDC088725 TaxID=3365873 RepID=UPI0038196755
MEPREFWDRNTVLAEAFCASDERVRQAQAVLDEAQAERSRTLAAFAVTVGNDGTIADLMGLNEREVRLARRTVGRSDARVVAEELLVRGPQQPRDPTRECVQEMPRDPSAEAHPAMEIQVPHPRDETVHPAPPPPPNPYMEPLPQYQYQPPTQPQPQDMTAPPALHATDADNAVIWSSSMDSVLLWSWKSGLDLQTVAAELGLDMRALLLRVQSLADDGLLTPNASPPPPEAIRSGRHRRHHEEAYAALFNPTTTFPTPVAHY